MLTRAQIKSYKSLKQKKFRDESGLFVVEGEKMVAEALASGWDVVDVITDSDAIAQISSLSTPPEKIAVVRKRDPSLAPLPQDDEGLRHHRGDGDLCCHADDEGLRHREGARRHSDAVGEESRAADGLYIALDGIHDPGNLGTILRLCDWFGVKKIFMSNDTVEIYNPKVVQSSMGSIFRVDFEYCHLEAVCTQFAGSIIGTFLQGENLYTTSLEPSQPTLIVIGSESFGISSGIAELCTRRVTIPSFGSACESLNAAIAAGIVISHYKGLTF